MPEWFLSINTGSFFLFFFSGIKKRNLSDTDCFPFVDKTSICQKTLSFYMTFSIKQINKLVLIRNSVLVCALMLRYLHGKLITTPWQQKREFSPECTSVKKGKHSKENTGVSWNTFCSVRPRDFLITFFLLLFSATRMDMICWNTWQWKTTEWKFHSQPQIPSAHGYSLLSILNLALTACVYFLSSK